MSPSTNTTHEEYEGKSSTGDFTEALNQAVRKSQGRGVDLLTTWEMVGVRGQFGGIGGLNDLTVVIRAIKSS